MNAVPDHFESPLDAAEFKRPARAGVELYRAHIVRHAFDPHLHDQAHLTRRFARMHGVTPARYQAQVEAPLKAQFQTRPRASGRATLAG